MEKNVYTVPHKEVDSQKNQLIPVSKSLMDYARAEAKKTIETNREKYLKELVKK